jgi:hypothetical protein
MSRTNELPNRFPEGTRYIIEGRAGRVLARLLEFPDGRRLNLGAPVSSQREFRRRGRVRKKGTQ